MTDEQPAELRVKVRLADGRIEAVDCYRAARLILAGQAAPEGRWSREELHAVLEAHEQRQEATARRLRRDGLLVGEGVRTAEPGPWGWLDMDPFAGGR